MLSSGDDDLTLDLREVPERRHSFQVVLVSWEKKRGKLEQNETWDLQDSPKSSGSNSRSPKIVLKKRRYLQARAHDIARLILTIALLAMLSWVIVWACIGHTPWNQVKEMLQIILPALTGLIGSAIGFYFGSKESKSR